MKTDYTREELIFICERAIVNVAEWNDRDTPSSQKSIGRVWAMLKAGCVFSITTKKDGSRNPCVTDENTIWGYVYEPTFSTMEEEIPYTDIESMKSNRFYLPTEKRLAESNGKDWY